MGKEGKETIIISRKCGMCETDWLNIRCVLVTRSAMQTLKQTVSFKTYSQNLQCHWCNQPLRNQLQFVWQTHVWQSRIEFEYHSSHISSTSPSLTHCSAKLPLKAGLIHTSQTYQTFVHMSPTPSGSSAPQLVKLSDAFEICNGIIFDFYPGLAHVAKYMHQMFAHTNIDQSVELSTHFGVCAFSQKIL